MPHPHRSYSTFREDASISDSASFLSTTTDDPLSSPSDGYFSQRSHPRDMFIDTDAANKGAKSQAQTQITVTSPQSASRYPHSQESTPLLESFVGQEAPPSYLEATTPQPWNARPSGDEGARLLSFDGRVSPGMREDGVMYGDMKYKKRSFREHCSRKRMLKWIAAILAIIILAAILAAVTQKEKKVIVSPIPVAPVESGAPLQPPKEFPIRWPSRCGKDYNTRTSQFDYGSPSDFQVLEGIAQSDGPYKRVSGWVHVVAAPEDQPAGTIRAKFSYAVSSSVDINSIKYSSSATGLSIGDPSIEGLLDSIQQGSACLGMSVVVYVAPGAVLENFNVRSVHLGMQVHTGVSFSVNNSTSISLTSGTLDASSFNSRETRLETISGSISGKYSLFDLLYINTISGSVNINIEPKEKLEGGKDAAMFQAKSLSGSIRADYERKEIPERDYVVAMETKVGSLDGTFIHGSKTSLYTVAGSITADFLPFKSGDFASELITNSHSGETMVTIRSPYKASGTGVNKLMTRHKSVSGAIDLTYPQEWEGHLEGTSLTGALHLQGKDLELIDEIAEPMKNHVEAKKGKGTSEMNFETVSGACEVKVGKL